MKNRINIILGIGMSMLSLVAAFSTENSVWLVCAILWIDLIFTEWADRKIIKMKKEDLELSNTIINELCAELKRQENVRVVMIEDIKIPKKYKKPRKEKMIERRKYFKEYKKFKVPIIIDAENNLIDGYTSYLIAKELGHNCISARIGE